MLRRAHDHHRDLRPLEPAPGAPALPHHNREDSFVTRHGLHHARAAATALRPTAPLVPDVVNCDPTLSFDHHSSTKNRRAVHQYRNEPPARHPRRRSNRSPHRPKIQFPIDQCLLAAGSFIQDFVRLRRPKLFRFCDRPLQGQNSVETGPSIATGSGQEQPSVFRLLSAREPRVIQVTQRTELPHQL